MVFGVNSDSEETNEIFRLNVSPGNVTYRTSCPSFTNPVWVSGI